MGRDSVILLAPPLPTHNKCSFGMRKLTYLRHVIAADQNMAQTDQVYAMLETPTALSKKDLRRFFGMCG